ncbi:MAG TPA: MopE-related protein [Candidatus Eisenbacteria bacterium]|nr:MopE-related protein [Candidatus Eisenbacteria bacterium]
MARFVLGPALIALVIGLPSRGGAATLTDTTVADFTTPPASGCYVAETTNGEVLLPPAAGTEFSGTGLDAGWASFPWCNCSFRGSGCPAAPTVTGGSLTLDSTAVATTPGPGFGPGRSLEFVATFRAEPFQHIGFGAPGDPDFPNCGSGLYSSPPWAMFSTKNDGAQVRARIANGSGTADIDVGFACAGGTCLGAPHRYRIDWAVGGDTTFFIDGIPVHHETALTLAAAMRPAASDLNNGLDLTVDWMRLTENDASCTFESQVLDGGASGDDWTTLIGTTDLPTTCNAGSRAGFVCSTDDTFSGNGDCTGSGAPYLCCTGLGTGTCGPTGCPGATCPNCCVTGTDVSFETRTGNSPAAVAAATYAAVSGGLIASPNGRYLQYRASLSTTSPHVTPEVQQVDVGYNPCTPTGPEVCDGIDNDCNGQVDDGNPGGGVSCNTGVPGVCAAGITQCQSPTLVCVQQNFPTAETCNGLDDDCDGSTDEGDPGSGAACSTGQPGICSAGVEHCVSGSLTCVANNSPTAETCNGLDDDCDGATDDGNPGGGGGCSTGLPGICAPGILMCQSGSVQCVEINPPGVETCNFLDDDCDGQVDEPYVDLGSACTVGVGACASNGVKVCRADHTGTVCNATPGSPSAEVCDGIDNDCDGQTDEGDPGSGGACTTGQPGICSAGTLHCQSGALACVANNSPTVESCNGLDDNCNGQTDEAFADLGTACSVGVGACAHTGVKVCRADHTGTTCNAVAGSPSTEICDGIDNDCDGQTDEGDPGSGGPCTTGQAGICAPGIFHCQGGSLTCVANNSPTVESCNGLDDNCNGPVDEPFTDLGSPCTVGVGACARTGNKVCRPDGTGTQCDTVPGSPSAEVCDGVDNDCDGQIDEGNPGSGGACTTGQQGVCSPGTFQCQGGGLVCVRNSQPTTEVCNGVDDDCDGVTDDGDPGGGAACSTGLPGGCDPGTRHCIGGQIVCQPNMSSMPELCNNVDDDCDGQVDEGNPGGGGACSTGLLGACAAGTQQCQNGGYVCVPNAAPTAELCLGGVDEDCDGQIDEIGDCVLCPAGATVSSSVMTKVTKVRLSASADRDKVQTTGTMILPVPFSIAPDVQDVTVRITDGVGYYYQTTIPAGHFLRSGSGRRFSFSDPTMQFGGIRKAKFTLRGDGVTVKYSFKSQGLNEPPFNAGTGAATIQIGQICFGDPTDACLVYSTGSASCR